ncbi:MAG: hypothetical protein ISS63_02810 [Desulfobacteraceae bacterium]|nr:hypothetical protein [Desulfobacteraceae bacterium]
MPKKTNGASSTKSLFDLYKQSKVNRFNFLQKKKQEFLNCTSERKRKNLIVELIQLEPSHLAEDWILDQVIKMMKDRQNNIDYLQAAFISRGKRAELTENQRDTLAKTSFLSHKISQMAEKKGSQIAAIRSIVLESDDDALPEQAEKAIEQKLKRYRKALDNRELPFPYYGLDFIECDEGNENQRIEFYIFDKPIIYKSHALFGSTKISIPAKKKSKMFIPFQPSTK